MFYSVLSPYANAQVPQWHRDNIITLTHSHLHTKEMTAHTEDTIRGRLHLRNLLGYNAEMIECVPQLLTVPHLPGSLPCGLQKTGDI